MKRLLISIILVSLFSVNSLAQIIQSANTDSVSYVASGESEMRAIIAIGRMSKVPIGIVLGKEYQRLCRPGENFKIVSVSPKAALEEVASRSGYLLTERDGVLVLTAPDLEEWQSEMLNYRFPTFSSGRAGSMASLGVTLTGWIRMVLGHEDTFAASIMSSQKTRKFSIADLQSASIEDVAERIVSLDGHGVWILRPTSEKPRGAQDEEVRVLSYLDDARDLETIGCGPR